MIRTKPTLLLALAVGGAVVAAGAQWAVGILGFSKVVPPLSLTVTLLLIAVIVVVLAWPVRRSTRGLRTADRKLVDPFFATRVVLIAKASAVTAALLGGAGVGLALEALARPVVSAAVVWSSAVMVIAAVLLVVAALLAEAWCLVPPEDDEGGPSAAR